MQRFTGTDPLAEEYSPFSPFNYTFNNPLRFIDPDGRGPETIFVDEQGNTLVETNDGSDEVFVIKNKNENNFIDDISASLQDGKESNVQKNEDIGLKNGYNIKEHGNNVDHDVDPKSNVVLDYSKIGLSDEEDIYLRTGYENGYNPSIENNARSESLSYADGSAANNIGIGRGIGKRHKRSGKMHAFNPKIKNNSPKYNKKALASGNPFEIIINRNN